MITFSETNDKKLHGQPGKFRLFFLSLIPLFLPPQGFPTAAFFPFSPCGKMSCFAERLDTNVIET